jgi:lysozyme
MDLLLQLVKALIPKKWFSVNGKTQSSSSENSLPTEPKAPQTQSQTPMPGPVATRLPLDGVEAATKIIKEFEGCKLEAYQDSVGVWTIGYGHTRTAAPGMKITQQVAEQLLLKDIQSTCALIDGLVKVSLFPNQWAALISFTFNVGAGNLRKSTLLKLLNEGKSQEASAEFKRWNKAGGIPLAGLSRRREAESKLFLKEN